MYEVYVVMQMPQALIRHFVMICHAMTKWDFSDMRSCANDLRHVMQWHAMTCSDMQTYAMDAIHACCEMNVPMSPANVFLFMKDCGVQCQCGMKK